MGAGSSSHRPGTASPSPAHPGTEAVGKRPPKDGRGTTLLRSRLQEDKSFRSGAKISSAAKTIPFPAIFASGAQILRRERAGLVTLRFGRLQVVAFAPAGEIGTTWSGPAKAVKMLPYSAPKRFAAAAATTQLSAWKLSGMCSA